MTTLEAIQAPINGFVKDFHHSFEHALDSQSEWMTKAIKILNGSTGKHVRPLLTGLVAAVCAGKTNSTTLEAAVLLEMIHTATLIHDDVIDMASTRRGVPTLNAFFDNRVAVLMGDFVLSSALMRAIALNDIRIITIISRLGRELSEGEIRQFETADKVIIDEDIYMGVIRQKTAMLFSACAEVGAITVQAPVEIVERVKRVGELLGYAFQIRDDIFDYYRNDVGKPTGNDIREGKITLPLLFALKNEQSALRDHCLTILDQKAFSEEDLQLLTSFAIEHGGIVYAERKMAEFIDKVKAELAVFPDSDALQSLLALADFIVQRAK
ncbi:polyprenyl synthetase [Porphyromonas gingivalis]|uniref:polyprenyl synthetase family protein n=1 Tax=Porphyromonas gingivalis TaxID=837 RepID=UPI000C187398|nr:polyprenyl synthetase family protein [Porphyromonas gingivalis]ATR90778.1 polyprenyl synthetase [Porphyromonas gingivalis]MCE8181546.1 polyprenyl synthetase family protein [Porphyromonas gingivalis]